MSVFETNVPQSLTTIIVLQDDSKLNLTMQFIPGDRYSIYIFNGLELYGDAIGQLIEQTESVILMPVFSDIQRLLAMFKFIYQLAGDDDKRKLVKEQFIECYNRQNNVESQPLLEEGQCSYPVVLPLIGIVDSKVLDSNVDEVESIMIQQLLRYLVLLHGGSLVSINDVNETIRLPHKVAKLVSELYDSDPLEIPLFSPKESNGEITLAVPRAWDSWRRISLLSQSIYYDEQYSKYNLFTDEAQIHRFTAIYLDYIRTKSTDDEKEDDGVNEVMKVVSSGYKPPSAPFCSTSPTVSYQTIMKAIT